MKEILRLENIHKVYSTGKYTLEALKGVSLSLHEGEVIAVMGGSGSGKSTLLYIIGAMAEATKGNIYLNEKKEEKYGLEPDATRIRAKNIGFIFQSFQLITDFTVGENVSLPLILAGESKKNILKKTEEILKLVKIEEKINSPVLDLSGGQQQRVAIARALIHEPKILLADEPTGNLDSQTAEDIMRLFLAIREKKGQSVIIVTHDPEIASYADRIIFLKDGRITGKYENSSNTQNINEVMKSFQESQTAKMRRED
ncbi:MAG: ABC transporter ATP-binding protein [Lachnospiraceae bacterium]|jgi:ABC-type lipoprotein export system ATPase subunit|nr:ABC transporter ATP-binding protein [Lachnospiraceae bacterium]